MNALVLILLQAAVTFTMLEYSKSAAIYGNINGNDCARDCADVMNAALTNVLGSAGSETTETRLLVPFHAVIASSDGSVSVAQRKIDRICNTVHKFGSCLRRCANTKAKMLRLAGVQQWDSLCDASAVSSLAFVDFLRCERRHFERIQRVCQLPAPHQLSELLPPSSNHGHGQPTQRMRHRLDAQRSTPNASGTPATSLRRFCRILGDYAKCYSNVPFQCQSADATKIWRRVNNSTLRSYNRLVELSAQHLKIPTDCQASISALSNRTISDELMPTASTPHINDERWQTKITLATTPRSSTTTKLRITTRAQYDIRSVDENNEDDYWMDASDNDNNNEESASASNKRVDGIGSVQTKSREFVAYASVPPNRAAVASFLRWLGAFFFFAQLTIF